MPSTPPTAVVDRWRKTPLNGGVMGGDVSDAESVAIWSASSSPLSPIVYALRVGFLGVNRGLFEPLSEGGRTVHPGQRSEARCDMKHLKAPAACPRNLSGDTPAVLTVHDLLQARKGEVEHGLGVALHRHPSPAHLVSRSGGRSGASEEVDHEFAWIARDVDSSLEQLLRLWCIEHWAVGEKLKEVALCVVIGPDVSRAHTVNGTRPRSWCAKSLMRGIPAPPLGNQIRSSASRSR